MALTTIALMSSMFNFLISPVFARPPPGGGSTVYLGTDKTFTSADRGDTGWWKWGLVPYLVYNGYRLSYKEATAFTMSTLAVVGWGGVGSWAMVGKYFYVSGSGSQAANIRAEGHLYGYLAALYQTSTGDFKVELIVKESTGATWQTTIKHIAFSGGWLWPWTYWVDEDFNSALTLVLQAGRSYTAYVKVTCQASVYGVGWSLCDVEYQDGESPNGYVRYSKIIVDF